MVLQRRHSFLDKLLGQGPKEFVVTCKDCGHKEHLFVTSARYETVQTPEVNIEDQARFQIVRKLPKQCPKCNGERLEKRKSNFIAGRYFNL